MNFEVSSGVIFKTRLRTSLLDLSSLEKISLFCFTKCVNRKASIFSDYSLERSLLDEPLINEMKSLAIAALPCTALVLTLSLAHAALAEGRHTKLLSS